MSYINIYKNLVILNGEDKTEEIQEICHEKKVFCVKFKSTPNKTYRYSSSNVKWYSNPIQIDINKQKLDCIDGELLNIIQVIKFEKHYRIFFENGESIIKNESDICIVEDILKDKTAENIFEYFKNVSENVSVKTDDGVKLLTEEYKKINFLSSNTVLAQYLNPIKYYEKKNAGVSDFIFPFGTNFSQITAVKTVMNNQISVIQGPPGTGKTQTILNIIANILMHGKNVAVVSNNNSATENVLEKMSKNGFDFLCAFLGKKENKEKFLNTQTGIYPNLALNKDNYNEKWKLKELISKILFQYEKENLNNLLKNKLEELKIEEKYFNSFHDDLKVDLPKVRSLKSLNNNLLRIKVEYEDMIENSKKISLWFKLKAVFLYGVGNRSFYKLPNETVSTCLSKLYYIVERYDIGKEISENKKILENENFKENKEKLQQLSLETLRKELSNKYSYNTERKRFVGNELYIHSKEFIKEYPVILSTTHSIKNCLGKDFIYDYVIIDESSQVDLITGVLALSCAKNVVIVGDLKQLPNVIEEDKRTGLCALADKYSIREQYNYANHSLLSSIIMTLPDVLKIMLKEHYRCHPKIINFCNRKFYNNELIIMTEDKNEKDVMKVYKTVEGNHAREHFNQRQVDEIKYNILPELNQLIDKDDIGIISPYRDQRDALQIDGVKVDTVHKFQGRECDGIILTTVDNEIGKFVDNPNLLNVAVSRAKKYLRVVVSDNEKNNNTNIGDLIRYIQYNNFEILKGKVSSVYDMLYKENATTRERYLKNKKRISEYDSENITYNLLLDILKQDKYNMLNVVSHIKLKDIISNLSDLTQDEENFLKRDFTHVDFLIYRIFDKTPVLVVEVDGYKYHNKNFVQQERDAKKDSILYKNNISIERLKTIGSMEREKIQKRLNDIIG